MIERAHKLEAGPVQPLAAARSETSIPLGMEALHRRLNQVLRVTVGLCFIGHGAWGVITKADWLPFFASMGIADVWAYRIMPVVGVVDISIGLMVLMQPRRIVLAYMFGWTVWTALLRPIAGFSMWEVWERGGNFGPPFALLMLGGAVGLTLREWFGRMEEPPLDRARLHTLEWVLRVALALLLIGHGGFGLFLQKQMLLEHYRAIGIPATTDFLMIVGCLEFALAALVLIRPFPALLWFVLVWKLASELLYPVAGRLVDTFEFIERAGDYGIPIALLYIQAWRRTNGGVAMGEPAPPPPRLPLARRG